MGNVHGSRRKRPIHISQDELSMSPERKRRRLLEESGVGAELPLLSSSLSPSARSTGGSSNMTSDDSFFSTSSATTAETPRETMGDVEDRQRKDRRKRLDRISRLLSLSSGQAGQIVSCHPAQLEMASPSAALCSSHSLECSPHSNASSGAPPTIHSTSASSLSACRRRCDDFPSPWLETLFLPDFPLQSAAGFDQNTLTLLGEVGRGSFGVVRRAQFKNLSHQLCVVKIQEKSAILLRDCVARVKNEIATLRRLPANPFVVQLLSAWQSRSKLFSCFAYPKGGCCDLFEVWRLSGGSLPEAAIRIIGAELSSALDFLHRHSVLYRDLKLENVIMDCVDGHVQLIDFGLSKTLAEGARTRTICGTLQYMAPEVARSGSCLAGGEGYGFSADWWSLGVFLHVLLTGRFPYPNADARHHDQLVYVDYSTPLVCSSEISSLLNAMLDVKLDRRLASFEFLHAHPFFASLNFGEVLSLKHRAMPLIREAQERRLFETSTISAVMKMKMKRVQTGESSLDGRGTEGSATDFEDFVESPFEEHYEFDIRI